MQRIFANVPVIYGFSSAAPVGAAAATRLDQYFAGGAGEIGSGRRDSRLLAIFAGNGMTATRGAPESQAYRRQVCGFFDERLTAAQKLSSIHATMRRDMSQAIAFVERTEGLLASLTAEERGSSEFLLALAEISADDATRDRYLAAERASAQPAHRARMIALATTLGWLSPAERAAELVGMVNDLLGSRSLGFGEVEAICALNGARELDGELSRVKIPPARVGHTAVAAALACLGDDSARTRVFAALPSADERDVQVAQVYLRHRPVSDAKELRAMARKIARMPGTAAQVRALDALGRLHVTDREVVEELTRSYAATTSVAVQRAIAEIFLRSGPKTIARPDLASVLREHRLESPNGDDLVEVLIRRLQSPS
jgi:hypothetical protein